MSCAGYDQVAEIYDLWSDADPASKDTYNFYTNICQDFNGSVLEIGVGTGRIAIDVAAKNKRVIGLDISEKMLDICKSRARNLNIEKNIKLIRADMRYFRISENVDLAIIPFRTIGHLLTLEDRIRCLKCIHKCLSDKGVLIFDHYNFSEDWARQHDRTPILMSHANISESEKLFIWDTYEYHFEQKCMNFFVTAEKTDGDGMVVSRRHASMTFSWLFPEDIREMLSESGFVIKEFYGEFNRKPFCEQTSRNQIILAVKA